MSTSQRAIPCAFMRGGTSRGPFFLAQDLPQDPAVRDQVLLAVMGSPDARQIDGLGGSDTLTSKVAIVSPSALPGVDVDFLFAQVAVDQPIVDFSPNCGNMLAGVGPFAIERGLVPVQAHRPRWSSTWSTAAISPVPRYKRRTLVWPTMATPELPACRARQRRSKSPFAIRPVLLAAACCRPDARMTSSMVSPRPASTTACRSS